MIIFDVVEVKVVVIVDVDVVVVVESCHNRKLTLHFLPYENCYFSKDEK